MEQMDVLGLGPADLQARLQAALRNDAYVAAEISQGLIEQLYADAIEVWHNYTTTEPTDGLQLRATAKEGMRRERVAFHAIVRDLEQRDTHVIVTEEAIVMTLRMCGSTPAGTRFDVPICIIYRRDEAGRIIRRETWADGAQMTELGKEIASSSGVAPVNA